MNHVVKFKNYKELKLIFNKIYVKIGSYNKYSNYCMNFYLYKRRIL